MIRIKAAFLIFLATLLLLGGYFMIIPTAALAATSVEYACLAGYTDGCVFKIEDPDEDVVCYITHTGSISCLELKGN